MPKVSASVFVVCLALWLPAPARAQIDPKILAAAAVAGTLILADDAAHEHAPWPGARGKRAAGWLSHGVVAGALVEPCLQVGSKVDAGCLKREALRVGLTVAATHASKHFIRRERPDKSDLKSFFSGHTALACVGGFSSKREAAGLALCAAAGYLRVAADRHWVTDVLVGAGVGWAMSRIAR